MLKGKKGLVVGVSNAHSLGWGVVQAWLREGANVCVAVQSERFKGKVEALLHDAGAADDSAAVLTCDFDDPNGASGCAQQVERIMGSKLDAVCHSVAFAPRTAFESRFVKTSREDFLRTIQTSAFSFLDLANSFEPLMARSRDEGELSSLMCLSFEGSRRVYESYKVMGPAKACLETTAKYLAVDLGKESCIRVNCISAGPVNTLSARGIPNFRKMLREAKQKSPLQNSVSQADVGNLAVFLASDYSLKMTGQVLSVDAGLAL